MKNDAGATAPAPASGVNGRSSPAPEPARPPQPPESWSDAEVKAARADCARRLSGLHAIFVESAPLKEGVCGLPAPIRLDGFDAPQGPRLSFSPPPTLSCKLAEALHRWMRDVVQPAAKKYLQAAIVRAGNLSAYQCRSRYDDPSQRISEHAFANAIDLHEFITAKGERVTVLDSWAGTDERSAFLHEIHAGACEIFGTTLGPEANEAHKNHFHLDLKERRKPLCDFTPEQERERKEEALRETARTAAKCPPSGSAIQPAAKTRLTAIRGAPLGRDKSAAAGELESKHRPDNCSQKAPSATP